LRGWGSKIDIFQIRQVLQRDIIIREHGSTVPKSIDFKFSKQFSTVNCSLFVVFCALKEPLNCLYYAVHSKLWRYAESFPPIFVDTIGLLTLATVLYQSFQQHHKSVIPSISKNSSAPSFPLNDSLRNVPSWLMLRGHACLRRKGTEFLSWAVRQGLEFQRYPNANKSSGSKGSSHSFWHDQAIQPQFFKAC
jgi:hypothetical protein